VDQFLAESLAEGDVEEMREELEVNPSQEQALLTAEKLFQEKLLIRDAAVLVNGLDQRWIKKTSRRELYQDYEEWAAQMGTDEALASYTVFCRVWQAWSPKVLRMREQMQHGRCTTCAEFSEARKRPSRRTRAVT
jgi:hypothetical protein